MPKYLHDFHSNHHPYFFFFSGYSPPRHSLSNISKRTAIRVDGVIRASRGRVIQVRPGVDKQLLAGSANQPRGRVWPVDVRHAPHQRVALEGKSAVGVGSRLEPGLEGPLRLVGRVLDVEVEVGSVAEPVLDQLARRDVVLGRVFGRGYDGWRVRAKRGRGGRLRLEVGVEVGLGDGADPVPS